MSSHKFKVGQLVTFFSRESASGLYEVTQLLPPEGDMFQVSDKKYQGTSRTRSKGARTWGRTVTDNAAS